MFGRVRRDDTGAAAVEFALVSVLLFTLLFGIIQYGFLFFQYQAAAATAHDAVRQLVAGPTDVQVVSGIPNPCLPFAQRVATVSEANGLPSGSVSLVTVSTPGGVPLQRGTLASVTLQFSPTTFGLAFVPTPGTVDVTAAGTVEEVNALRNPCSEAP